MRSLILLAAFVFAGVLGVKAQSSSIQNTAWKMYVDELHDTITLHLKNDSSYATQGSESNVVVRSVCKISKDTLKIKDYEGQYACPGEEGVYTYKIEGNVLTMYVVGDACEGRRGTIAGVKWIKVQ